MDFQIILFLFKWALQGAQCSRICLPSRRYGLNSWIFLSQEDPLEKNTATHSSILVREIPWTEQPRRLQSTELQSWTRLSNWRTTVDLSMDYPGGTVEWIRLQCKRCGFSSWVGNIPWRRKWQPPFNILAWENPWTEEPSGLQSMGSQKSQRWLRGSVTTNVNTAPRYLFRASYFLNNSYMWSYTGCQKGN